MFRNLLFTSTILLITSCNSKTEEQVVVENFVDNILTLEFASKNPEVKKEGTNVSASEMLQLSLIDNSQSDFVGKSLTLNNTIKGSINFSSRNDSIFCISPTSLILMSMPPKPGVPPAKIGANAEFYVSPMSLLKFDSVSIMFVGIVN